MRNKKTTFEFVARTPHTKPPYFAATARGKAISQQLNALSSLLFSEYDYLKSRLFRRAGAPSPVLSGLQPACGLRSAACRCADGLAGASHFSAKLVKEGKKSG
jgi:hypothetical protein